MHSHLIICLCFKGRLRISQIEIDTVKETASTYLSNRMSKQLIFIFYSINLRQYPLHKIINTILKDTI